jgi:hypothetical protein
MSAPVTLFRYCCPNTGQSVQGISTEEVVDDDTWEQIVCIACRRLHFVNPTKGKVLGADDDEYRQ